MHHSSGLETAAPIGKGVSGNFTKTYFDGKCMKCPDLQTKLHCCQPPLLIGLGGSNLLKELFTRELH